MKFSGVMIGSDNPGRLADFYTEILGEPGFHEGTWWGWESKAGLMIGEHSEVHGASENPQRILLGFDTDDVAGAFRALVDLGAGVIAEPYQPEADSPEVWLATVTDPDGNYVQLITPWQ